jgi:hypothetical protein
LSPTGTPIVDRPELSLPEIEARDRPAIASTAKMAPIAMTKTTTAPSRIGFQRSLDPDCSSARFWVTSSGATVCDGASSSVAAAT